MSTRSIVRPSIWSAGRQHPGFEHGRRVAMLARDKPGEWVDLAAGCTVRQADHQIERVLKKPSVAFQPQGSFEARGQRHDVGLFTVQVRYVGQP